MRSRLVAAASVVALVGAIAIAVPAGASGAPAQASAGDPIKIGLTFVCDAPAPPSVCEMEPSIEAAVKTFNAKGGAKTADGTAHKFELVVCNNENDRAKTADCARQFVDEEVAFATGGAVFSEELVPILDNAGIAYFNPTPLGQGTAEGTGKLTYVLGFTLGLFQGLTQELVDADFETIGVVAQGAGVALGNLVEPIAEAGGSSIKLVEVPAENPNWAQAAQEAADGTDVIVMVADEQNTKAFIDAYRQSGNDVPVTSVIGIITTDLIKATGGPESPLLGGVSTGYFPPAQDKAWADFRKSMNKYAKGTQFEPAGQSMWMGVQLAREIIGTISGEVTAATFIAAVDATTEIPTLGGKLPSGKSFQAPEGIFPRIFNNDYWGPLKITGKTIGNAKGAQFSPAPSAE
jgi:ABC-type branched-subunit amino acid transport system substrate-binding protein